MKKEIGCGCGCYLSDVGVFLGTSGPTIDQQENHQMPDAIVQVYPQQP